MSYQRPIFTETNQYSKNNTHKFIPITTTNESTKENPIRIFNKNSFNSKLGNSTNYSFFANKNKSYNKHNYLNTRTKNLSEGELNIRTSKNKLPLISQTEPNINIKVSKKKLEDIINMFKKEPENNSFLQKKYKFKHRGLIPGIPNDIFLRLKYNHDIFNNKKFIEYVKDAPSRKKYELEEITDYLWKYKKDHSKTIIFYAIFFYYLCTNIQYDVENINENENTLI